MNDIVIDVHDEFGTQAVGQTLAQYLPEGSVVALIGTLGAGKTLLVQAAAEALGNESGVAASPTFVLLNEYDGGAKPIYHFDTYRLDTESQFRQLGPDDYFESGGITFIEWADKFPAVLPEEHLEVRIEILDETRRRFRITATGAAYQDVLVQLRQCGNVS